MVIIAGSNDFLRTSELSMVFVRICLGNVWFFKKRWFMISLILTPNSSTLILKMDIGMPNLQVILLVEEFLDLLKQEKILLNLVLYCLEHRSNWMPIPNYNHLHSFYVFSTIIQHLKYLG